ncbi:MAG: hypothetical protein EXR50_05255 [Dehalococcoidia bacterium]|nr:hypothetical protein [Dehalococcoidia bacterium]
MTSYESTPIGNTVKWLEDEQRQSRAITLKVQQQLDQVQAAIWAQTEQLHLLEDGLSSTKSITSRLPKLEANVQQLAEALGRTQEAKDELKLHIDEIERYWTGEFAREREERSQLVKQVGELTSEVRDLVSKAQLAEETARHIQTNLTQISSQVEALSRHHESLDSTVSLIQDSQRHRDQDVKRLDQEQESLRTADEVTLGRLMSLGERVRAIEDEERFLSLEERLRGDMTEKSNLQTTERQRLERQVVEAGAIQSQHSLTLEALEKRLGQADERDQTLAHQLTSLREQMWGMREAVLTNLARLGQIIEGQRRREIANMEQNILELRAHLNEGARD